MREIFSLKAKILLILICGLSLARHCFESFGWLENPMWNGFWMGVHMTMIVFFALELYERKFKQKK